MLYFLGQILGSTPNILHFSGRAKHMDSGLVWPVENSPSGGEPPAGIKPVEPAPAPTAPYTPLVGEVAQHYHS